MKKPRSIKELYKILLKFYIEKSKKTPYANCICQVIILLTLREMITLNEKRKLLKHFLTQYYRVEKMGGIFLEKSYIRNNYWFTPGEHPKREQLLKAIIKDL